MLNSTTETNDPCLKYMKFVKLDFLCSAKLNISLNNLVFFYDTIFSKKESRVDFIKILYMFLSDFHNACDVSHFHLLYANYKTVLCLLHTTYACS